MFWIICACLTLAILAMIVAPMLRGAEAAAEEDPQVALYKAQLAEVDRDVAREVLAPEEAERAKTEIARRLLAANQTAQATAQSPITLPVVGGVAVLVALGTAGTYWTLGAPGYADLPLQTRIALGDEARANRPSQAQAEAATPPRLAPEVPADVMASIEQLRAVVPQRGDDLQGWELLAFYEAELGNYAAAAKAQARVVAIKGADVATEDLIRQADLMVVAANGFVSPETEQVVRDILELNPQSIAARYYLGAMFDQTDRPDRAFRLWRSLLESGAPESYHMALARRQVTEAAFRAGVDYTPPTLPGPSMEQMMAAEDMNPEDRAEMINGMVAALSDRLATQGGTVAEWARLIVAHGVLGDTDQAKAVLAEARDVFGASDEAMAVLNEAASSAGLAE